LDGLHAAFTGRVGGAPELRYTPNGKAALAFNVVVADVKAAEKGDEAMWIRCTAWEAAAEQLQIQLSKGSEVYCEGKLKPSKWQTKEGEQRFGLNCSCWKVEVLGKIGHNAPKRTVAPIGASSGSGPAE